MSDIYREYMCDVCLDNGEDTNSLSYDPNEKNFKCSKGHSESAEQMFRFEEAPELVRIIMDLLDTDIMDNESICSGCDKKIDDDVETKWDSDADPYCKECFTDELNNNKKEIANG